MHQKYKSERESVRVYSSQQKKYSTSVQHAGNSVIAPKMTDRQMISGHRENRASLQIHFQMELVLLKRAWGVLQERKWTSQGMFSSRSSTLSLF